MKDNIYFLIFGFLYIFFLFFIVFYFFSGLHFYKVGVMTFTVVFFVLTALHVIGLVWVLIKFIKYIKNDKGRVS